MRFDFDLYGDRVVRQVSDDMHRLANVADHLRLMAVCMFILCLLGAVFAVAALYFVYCRRARSRARGGRDDLEATGGREEDLYITIGGITVRLAVTEVMERPTPLQQPPPPGEAHALPSKTRIEPQTMLLTSERHATRSSPSIKQTVAAYSAQRHGQYGPE